MLIICWDYDGTLVSSENIYKNLFFDLINKNKIILNKIPDNNYFKHFAGCHPYTLFYKLQNEGFLNKNFLLDLNEINKIFKNYLQQHDDLILNKGIIPLLDSLSRYQNILMAIVTSTVKEDFDLKYSKKSVELLKKYFDIKNNIYICGEVGNKKLKPDPNGYIFAYNDLIKKHKLSKEEICLVMIEDSISGCKAAYEAKLALNFNSKFEIIGFCPQEKNIQKTDLQAAGASKIFYDSNDLFLELQKIASSSCKKL